MRREGARGRRLCHHLRREEIICRRHESVAGGHLRRLQRQRVVRVSAVVAQGQGLRLLLLLLLTEGRDRGENVVSIRMEIVV